MTSSCTVSQPPKTPLWKCPDFYSRKKQHISSLVQQCLGPSVWVSPPLNKYTDGSFQTAIHTSEDKTWESHSFFWLSVESCDCFLTVTQMWQSATIGTFSSPAWCSLEPSCLPLENLHTQMSHDSWSPERFFNVFSTLWLIFLCHGQLSRSCTDTFTVYCDVHGFHSCYMLLLSV